MTLIPIALNICMFLRWCRSPPGGGLLIVDIGQSRSGRPVSVALVPPVPANGILLLGSCGVDSQLVAALKALIKELLDASLTLRDVSTNHELAIFLQVVNRIQLKA